MAGADDAAAAERDAAGAAHPEQRPREEGAAAPAAGDGAAVPAAGECVGGYRVRKLLHASDRTAVFLADSAMGDAVVVKRCRRADAARERAVLLELKQRDPACTHIVRLLDYVEEGSLRPTAAQGADEEPDGRVGAAAGEAAERGDAGGSAAGDVPTDLFSCPRHNAAAGGGRGGELYEALVLEACEHSLEGWLRARAYRPTWAEVLDVGGAVGRALAWLHEHGICHGDVKPANVLRAGGGGGGG